MALLEREESVVLTHADMAPWVELGEGKESESRRAEYALMISKLLGSQKKNITVSGW